jgi:hypothetical protein
MCYLCLTFLLKFYRIWHQNICDFCSYYYIFHPALGKVVLYTTCRESIFYEINPSWPGIVLFSDSPDYDNFYDDFLDELFDNDIPPPNNANNPLHSNPLNPNPLHKDPISSNSPVKTFGVGNKSPTLRPRPGPPSQSTDQKRKTFLKSPLGKYYFKK